MPPRPLSDPPQVLAGLIAKGALGQKPGAGFFKKVGKDILRLDPAKGDYVPAVGKGVAIVGSLLKQPAAVRMKLGTCCVEQMPV